MTVKQILLFAFLSFKKNNYYGSFNYILSKKNKVVLIDINNFEEKNNTENNTVYDINNSTAYYLFLKQPIVNVKPYISVGIDERFNGTEINNEEIKKILNNHERKNLLDKLTDPKLPQSDKLKLIENSDYLTKINCNEIKGSKMLNGGLMKDWNRHILNK